MNLDGFIHAIDGVDFARRRLGFDPDAKQSLVLGKRVRRGLLNCSRQWGSRRWRRSKQCIRRRRRRGVWWWC